MTTTIEPTGAFGRRVLHALAEAGPSLQQREEFATCDSYFQALLQVYLRRFATIDDDGVHIDIGGLSDAIAERALTDPLLGRSMAMILLSLTGPVKESPEQDDEH